MVEPAMDPYAWPESDVLRRLKTGPTGLDTAEADLRLRRNGPNRLRTSTPRSAVALFLDQFKSVVVWLLIGAALLALSMGERIDAAAVAIVLLLNAGIGWATEYRARRAISALLQLDVPRCVVVRDSRLETIDAERLVPGDLVVLAAGQRVPADARIITESDLTVDEAALTGESLPVAKSPQPVPVDTPLAERRSMVYKGTMVSTGTSRVAVTATGTRTEVGRVGTLTASVTEGKTPLERRLDELGTRLVWMAIAVGALVAVVGASQGQRLVQTLQLGIALAVAAVPEALPAVATIALALGVRRMAARHALVRRLPVVETLGSTTVVCTDKTRTLTSGTMTVATVWTSGEEFAADADGLFSRADDARLRIALEVATLASQPQSSSKHDPVDRAIMHAAALHGIAYADLERDRPATALLPFASRRKFMASFRKIGPRTVAYVKGAPDVILARVGRIDGARATADDVSRLEEANEQLASRGLRILALAYGDAVAANDAAVRDLTFAGFVGLIDPPAHGVKDTVARLQRAGLRLIMVTGDQRLTAEAVGRAIGVMSGDARVIGHRELDAMSEPQLQHEMAHVAGFARVTPEQKLTIVRALQARGEIVAMIGDGINDAAALKQADVGVAMGGRGTDVAKEAAAIVLQDDRLETIAAAVEEGRVIFDNIRKFVFYLFSCNVGEVLVVLGAGVLGLPQPLGPLQILWLNLVTDTFPALALAAEPGEPTVMRRPPREPKEALLSGGFLRSIFGYGLLITLSTLAAFVWFTRSSPPHAVSAAFTTLALGQILHLGNARSADAVVAPSRALANRVAVAAVFVTIGLQLSAIYLTPLANVLDLQPLPLSSWIVLAPMALVPAIAGQGIRWFRSRPAEAGNHNRS